MHEPVRGTINRKDVALPIDGHSMKRHGQFGSHWAVATRWAITRSFVLVDYNRWVTQAIPIAHRIDDYRSALDFQATAHDLARRRGIDGTLARDDNVRVPSHICNVA